MGKSIFWILILLLLALFLLTQMPVHDVLVVTPGAWDATPAPEICWGFCQ